MAKTKIEWTDITWSPVTGCTKISEGCQHCYGESIAKRFWGDRKFSDIRIHSDRILRPKFPKKPSRIFVCSMSDLFHKEINDHQLGAILSVIRNNPQHTFQILTKRPERALEWKDSLSSLPNIMLGVTTENQAMYDARVPYLLQIDAKVRFISIEPALGRVEICFDRDVGDPYNEGRLTYKGGIDWVIYGGETGLRARKGVGCWAPDVWQDCKEAGIPFFFKGWGTAIMPKSHPKYHNIAPTTVCEEIPNL